MYIRIILVGNIYPGKLILGKSGVGDVRTHCRGTFQNILRIFTFKQK